LRVKWNLSSFLDHFLDDTGLLPTNCNSYRLWRRKRARPFSYQTRSKSSFCFRPAYNYKASPVEAHLYFPRELRGATCQCLIPTPRAQTQRTHHRGRTSVSATNPRAPTPSPSRPRAAAVHLDRGTPATGRTAVALGHPFPARLTISRYLLPVEPCRSDIPKPTRIGRAVGFSRLENVQRNAQKRLEFSLPGGGQDFAGRFMPPS
jgi:hypothetical protein